MKDFMEVAGLLSMLPNRLGAVALSFPATKERIDAISKIDWATGAATHREAKDRMKEVGGNVFQYSTILHENSLLSLAKVIEDTSIDLRKSSQKFRIHVIKNHHHVAYLKELQTIVALANVIKHNQSRLSSGQNQAISTSYGGPLGKCRLTSNINFQKDK